MGSTVRSPFIRFNIKYLIIASSVAPLAQKSWAAAKQVFTYLILQQNQMINSCIVIGVVWHVCIGTLIKTLGVPRYSSD